MKGRLLYESQSGQTFIEDVPESGAGTLLVKDRTHSEHAHFFETSSILTREQQAAVPDFYIFKPEELAHWDSFKTLPLAAKAGSVFLWDSRTVHAVRVPSSSVLLQSNSNTVSCLRVPIRSSQLPSFTSCGAFRQRHNACHHGKSLHKRCTRQTDELYFQLRCLLAPHLKQFSSCLNNATRDAPS